MTNRSTLVHTDELDERVTSLTADVANLSWDNEILQESLSVLELQLENQGWQSLAGNVETELSRETLRKINVLARTMWLKNPLIQRGVNVQAFYVFGQGIEVSAEDEEVNEIIRAFWNDARNQAELTLQQALLQKEQGLTLFGNIYFVLFDEGGKTLVRTIPASEVVDIICNPEDAKEPWWYKRVHGIRDLGGEIKQRITLYKDWRYMGDDKPTGKLAEGASIEAAPVFHLKVGCLDDMKFGVSEVYAALDWATAYKSFLENWSTIVAAYARFAWRLTLKSRKGIATAKAKLSTTVSSTATETNPSPVAGSTFIGPDGVGMAPIRTAGATTSAKDGRQLLLMVAATMGLPETFFGDVSVGTLATASSMDRPTELKFVARQGLWGDTLRALLDYVVIKAIEGSKLKGTVTKEPDGTPSVELSPPTTTNAKDETVDRSLVINVNFPPVLEHDIMASVDAIAKAATLGGSALADTIDRESLTRMLLTALGEKDIEARIEAMFPPGWEEEEERKEEKLRQQFVQTRGSDDESPEVEAMMVAAVENLGRAVDEIREG